MANVQITQLPTAGALTGSEAVPVVQNGVTVQTTTGQIATASTLSTYPFLTVVATPSLASSRYLSTTTGLGLTDDGAGSNLVISLNGVSGQLETSSAGFQVKTNGSTLTNRTITVSGSGLAISNGNGISGNPVISTTGVLANFASTSGTGLVTINGTTVSQTTIQGTSNQTTVTNGNASGGQPTIGLANNVVLPGTGGAQLPSGDSTTRINVNGVIRYNTANNVFEGYQNGSWSSFGSGSGTVTTVGGTSNQINVANGTTTPTISIANNPVLPGNGGVVLPQGGTAQRSAVNGTIRYNTDTLTLEAYTNSAWGVITTSSTVGVTLINTGTGLTGGPITSSGTIAIDTTVVATLNGTQTLTNKTISGSTNTLTNIGNSSLTNSSLTVNGTSISLGGSGTVTATTTNALTIGTGLSGTSFNGSAPVTIAISNTGVTSGTYGSASVIPVIQVNSQGQITSVSTQAINSPTYQGTWNASTNTPTLTSSVGTQSYYYVVSVAGNTTLNGVSGWNVGDWAIFTGGVWEKVPGSSSESFTNLTTTNLAVSGLTGYMYANGSSNVTASSTIPTSALTGTLGISNGGTGQTTASAAFNALSPITTTGDLIIGNGSNSATRLAIGSNGYVLTSNGTTASWQASTGGVTSFSAGTTGFTPSTGTTGAVTLSGTLNVANGGTGVTSSSGANSVVLRDSNGNIVWNNEAPGYTNIVTAAGTTTLTASATRYQHFSGTSTQTLKLPDETTIPTAMGYIVDNDSTGNVTVQDSGGNTLATAVPGGAGWIYSLSNASATGNWAGYLLPPGNSATAPLTWGTAGLNMASSYIQGITTLNMSGQLTNTVATGTAPFVVSSTTQVANLNAATAGTATNATNVAATAGSGSTNYLTFVSSATGNVGVNTNSSLTYNYTNNALTAGINGGTF